MRRVRLSLPLLLSCTQLLAAYRPIGQALPERFDPRHQAWVGLPTQIEFDPQLGKARLRLAPFPLGQVLTARLDFKHLPHFEPWMAQRRAEGGPSWTALKAILDDIGDGPAMALTQAPLAAEGRLHLLVGLRRGSRFELYATLTGFLDPCGKDRCFEPLEVVFASQSAALAWTLLRPLALKQAKAASNR